MGDLSSIPGFERSPGEANSYPLQYSGLENSMDRVVHGVTELDMIEQLSLYLLCISTMASGYVPRMVLKRNE